jgi:hypothetical protein
MSFKNKTARKCFDIRPESLSRGFVFSTADDLRFRNYGFSVLLSNLKSYGMPARDGLLNRTRTETLCIGFHSFLFGA